MSKDPHVTAVPLLPEPPGVPMRSKTPESVALSITGRKSLHIRMQFEAKEVKSFNKDQIY